MFVRPGDDSVHCVHSRKAGETESYLIKVNPKVLLSSLNQAPLALCSGELESSALRNVTVPAFDRFCLLRDASHDVYCLLSSAYWFENRCY